MQLGRTKRSQVIRAFLVDSVRSGKKNVIADACDHFSISRQSVHRHLAYLTEQEFLVAEGTTRARTYHLGPIRQQEGTYALSSIAEDRLYRNDFAFVFEGLPKNIENICHYGFTEMVNNAIDHSGGTQAQVAAVRTSEQVALTVRDDGEGIFNRIARLMGLGDPREALLELSKGKLTTDPDHHTGEGIFFTSRAFDVFIVRSGDLMFNHLHDSPIDMMNHADTELGGTLVWMAIALDSQRTLKSVFDEYTDQETYDFTKTVVPVRLALYEGDQLISRSQAKRVMNRVERFRSVMLDFHGVDMVGRSFADEIFRVFAAAHPEITIKPINMNDEVAKALDRVRDRPATDGH
jgi:anti-sigma regulatory factor (Ser/Thr protein kinase)